MYELQVHNDSSPDHTYSVGNEVTARQFAAEEIAEGARRVVIVGPDGRVVDEVLARDGATLTDREMGL